jgi:nucleotide-binding universal stress UspA family protein/alkylhydroperoxidase/carboxymuconolactone decarboxylase family protein YurZ
MSDVFKRLLLATEHSEFDTGAETLALALAQRCGLPLAAVMPVLSNPEFEMVAPQLAEQADTRAAQQREHLQATGRRPQGVALRVRMRRGPEPFAEIVAEARDAAADLLIIRRRGQRGLLANLLVGEMVSKVVAHAPCCVLVSPRGARMWQQRRAAGAGPGRARRRHAGLATALAAECGLPLHVLCVASAEGGRVRRAAGCGRGPVAGAAAACPRAALRAAVQGEVRVGRVHQELLAGAAACGADLIVLAPPRPRNAGPRLDRRRGAKGHRPGAMPGAGASQPNPIQQAMSDALNYLVKARGDALGHYFAFLKECGKHLDPKTRNLISVITKVDAQTERGFKQYLGRALREGCSPMEVLDALLMAFPTLGLAKIVWATDIILAMDLPEFQPGAMGAPGEWHDVMATKGFKVGSTQRVDCSGRGLFVHRAGKEWRVFDSRCPHQTTNIPHLALKDCTLTCSESPPWPPCACSPARRRHQRHEHGRLWPRGHRHGRRVAGHGPRHRRDGPEPGHAGTDGAHSRHDAAFGILGPRVASSMAGMGTRRIQRQVLCDAGLWLRPPQRQRWCTASASLRKVAWAPNTVPTASWRWVRARACALSWAWAACSSRWPGRPRRTWPSAPRWT